MVNTLMRCCFLGTRSVERDCTGFTAALRRATVPAEEVVEHAHAGAHLVLAIDATYLSAARGSADRNGPMTLVYNPPGTLHRDRFAVTGGRFMSIDLDPGLVHGGPAEPLVVADIEARAGAGRIAGMIGTTAPDAVELEALLLDVVAHVHDRPATSRHMPCWLGTAAEALADLAGNSALQVREVARLAGVHPVHFAREFRRHFGCGPSKALRRHRVARAAGLLSRGSRLADIALQAGFADQSHMSRAFRHEYGTTPARFREAFR